MTDKGYTKRGRYSQPVDSALKSVYIACRFQFIVRSSQTQLQIFALVEQSFTMAQDVLSIVSHSASPYGPPLLKAFVALGVLGIVLLARFVYTYRKALRQFPGPPVESFWTGNLDQTMADDVHEKWRKWHVQYGYIFQTVSKLYTCTR